MESYDVLRGCPQLLLASQETLPNVLGMLEFKSNRYRILATPTFKGLRLRRALGHHGFTELGPPIVIDGYESTRTANLIAAVEEELRARAPRGWIWNYTPGTKQMMLGVQRGLRVGQPDSIVRGAIYIDTRADKIFLDRAAPRRIETRLDIGAILAANGIPRLDSDEGADAEYTFTLGEPMVESNGPIRAARILGDNFLAWRRYLKRTPLEQLQKSVRAELPVYARDAATAVENDMHPGQFLSGIWLEYLLAEGLLALKNNGEIDEVVRGIALRLTKRDKKGHPIKSHEETDLDICAVRANTLYYFSCKARPKSDQRHLRTEAYNIAARCRRVGGRLARGSLCHCHENETVQTSQVARIVGVELLNGYALHNRDRFLARLREIMGVASPS